MFSCEFDGRITRRLARRLAPMSLARTERAALADLFEQVGPDQPTLCEGWTTLDLLIHLLVRERDPLGRGGNPGQAAARPSPTRRPPATATGPGAELVQAYRSGPPGWNPTGWGPLDDLFNGGEMFIHHEDVRRGQPGWQPRELNEADTAGAGEDGPLGHVQAGAAQGRRRHRGPDLPGQEPITLRKGDPVVTLTGDPGEIVLWTVRPGRGGARSSTATRPRSASCAHCSAVSDVIRSAGC